MDEETLEEAAKKRVPTSASVWDLTETDSSGIITRRIEGRATVTPSVTR